MIMKKYIYSLSSFVLAFAIAGIPTAFAHTQNIGVSDGVGDVANITTSISSTTKINSLSSLKRNQEGDSSVSKEGIRTPERSNREKIIERAKEQFQRKAERARELSRESRDGFASSSDKAFSNEKAREQLKQQAEKTTERSIEARNRTSSSSKAFLNEKAREQFKQRAEHIREAFKNRIEFIRESTTTPVHTLAQLKKMIIARRAKIKSEVASTTTKYRKIVAQATSVRVAVQALVASKDLLGAGIGKKVSEIAKQVNNSVASTTNVEAQIQSRGFFTRLFFGGDTRAADEIKKQVIQNQDRIIALSGLLSKSNTTQEIKTELGDQVQAMQDEQSRLQEVAQRQSKLWGLFSWRLF